MGLTVEDIQSGMVLTWQSGAWPHKTSRWIVLEQLEDSPIEGRRFNIYCIQDNTKKDAVINRHVIKYSIKTVHTLYMFYMLVSRVFFIFFNKSYFFYKKRNILWILIESNDFLVCERIYSYAI